MSSHHRFISFLGPPVYPMVGCIFSTLNSNIHVNIDEWGKIYGPIIGLIFPGGKAVAITNPKLALEVVKHEDIQSRFSSYTISNILKSKGTSNIQLDFL